MTQRREEYKPTYLWPVPITTVEEGYDQNFKRVIDEPEHTESNHHDFFSRLENTKIQ